MKKPRDVIQPRWAVFRLRKRAERVPFTVTAKDAERGIERNVFGWGAVRLMLGTPGELSKACALAAVPIGWPPWD